MAGVATGERTPESENGALKVRRLASDLHGTRTSRPAGPNLAIAPLGPNRPSGLHHPLRPRPYARRPSPEEENHARGYSSRSPTNRPDFCEVPCAAIRFLLPAVFLYFHAGRGHQIRRFVLAVEGAYQTKLMRCLIWHCCCSEKATMAKPAIIGGGIWREITHRNGPLEPGAR